MAIPTLSWRVFYKAGSLAATDPKDHVYGLLGITGINIQVDYSQLNSVANVFHDVVAAWLQDHARPDKDLAAETAVSKMKELWFLSLAGLRRDCDDVRCQDLASWAPNFPHFHHNRSDYVFFTEADADHGVFSEEQCLTATYIQGPSLFVTGLVVDSVHETYPQIISSSHLFDLLSGLFRENEPQFSEAGPRRRLLRDLFELLCWNNIPKYVINARLRVNDPVSSEYLAFACAFVWAILCGGFQYRTAIERLGLRSDTETGFSTSLRETFLGSREGFKDGYEHNKVSHFDNNSSSWLQDLLDCEAAKGLPKEPRLASSCQEMTFFVLTDGLDDCCLFRTSRGYFRLACSKSTASGDLICVLKGHDSTASLRVNGDHFHYVGDIKVQGMMEGQAAGLSKEGLAEVRQFELR